MGPFHHHTPLKQGTRNHFLPRMSCFSFVFSFHSFSFLPPLCILNLVKSVRVLLNVLEIKRVKPYLFIPLNERKDAHSPRCIYQTALTVPNYMGKCSDFAVRRAAILNFVGHQTSSVRKERGLVQNHGVKCVHFVILCKDLLCSNFRRELKGFPVKNAALPNQFL